MQRYDSYKPSGVEWIGEVPSHWEYGRIKYLLSRSSAGVWGDDALENEDDIICYRVADFDYNRGILNQDNITFRNIQSKQLVGRLVSKGDLLVEKSGGGETTPVGRVVRVNFSDRATCSNFIHSLSVNIKNNSSFLYYYFHQLYSKRINLLFFNQTTGIQNLQIDCYLSQGLYLPPLEEQERIAEYLDRRCAEIDSIINKEEQAIALLDELKQTIISEAVTRGLDPTVPLKPSGVDWIGNIPSHWEVSRVKYLGTTLNGLTYKPINVTGADTGVLVLRASNIQNGMLTFEDNVYVDMQIPPELMVQTNDIIICSTNGSLSLVGKLAIVSSDLHATFGSFMLLFRNSPNQHFSHYMLNVVIPKYKALFATTTINQLTKTTFGNMFCPLPPLEEQERIAEYLDKRCAEIDEAKERKQRQIELLREMKQTLISDAVTGRVKVF